MAIVVAVLAHHITSHRIVKHVFQKHSPEPGLDHFQPSYAFVLVPAHSSKTSRKKSL
jgi:hypothetical protein